MQKVSKWAMCAGLSAIALTGLAGCGGGENAENSLGNSVMGNSATGNSVMVPPPGGGMGNSATGNSAMEPPPGGGTGNSATGGG